MCMQCCISYSIVKEWHWQRAISNSSFRPEARSSKNSYPEEFSTRTPTELYIKLYLYMIICILYLNHWYISLCIYICIFIHVEFHEAHERHMPLVRTCGPSWSSFRECRLMRRVADRLTITSRGIDALHSVEKYQFTKIGEKRFGAAYVLNQKWKVVKHNWIHNCNSPRLPCSSTIFNVLQWVVWVLSIIPARDPKQCVWAYTYEKRK